ncbi:hypothetical protein CYMTET_5195 [Cymbomonas tetramitiformis]|uniref:Uncharacterized protein n=1 Tax=Cymbomonas tetramitiformis TaxID=36881 RepID=A0AAE0GZL1_9CHLO|nr:hypothetical protein CYMTET_5195 [Cymbomonas tetramitiformis]
MRFADGSCETPQVPTAEETPTAAFHSVRLTDPAPGGDPITGNTDGKHSVVPAASDDASPLLEETPACFSAALHDAGIRMANFPIVPCLDPEADRHYRDCETRILNDPSCLEV